jgi:XTP/dITP diphosphohydrolase
MKEVREIVSDLPYEVLSMKEARVAADPEEDGKTFEENALIKARAVAKLLPEGEDAIVIADDSGLEIDYLDKAPGIYSARFMGHDTSYEIKNQALLDKLAGVPKEKRSARFVCAIAAVCPDGEEYTTRGTMEGFIAEQIAGANGFGYDPIFWVEEYQCTSAELTEAQKNEISHRGKALRAIKKYL